MKKFEAQRNIWLTGSRRTIRRAIYESDGKFYINWYGSFIEVLRGTSAWYTVDMY